MNPPDTQTVVFAYPGNEDLAAGIATAISATLGSLEIHQFPDGESLPRIHTAVSNCHVVLVATLHQPDSKLLPLIFTADTLRDLGAVSVTLVAPYLSYMRQDQVFREGEGITARYFASTISSHFDALLTVDPHLHRIADLSEVYACRSRLVHAAPLLAAFIARQIPDAIVIGPDSESEQWVTAIANAAGVPWLVMQKQRSGDREVAIAMHGLEQYRHLRPVLADDIISTGRTMAETAQQLITAGFQAPICLGVHAVFAEGAWLLLTGICGRNIYTCNTIPHQSNAISVLPALSAALGELIGH